MRGLILFLCLNLSMIPSFANSVAEYEARRQAYLSDTRLLHSKHNLIAEAYLGSALNQVALDATLEKIVSKVNADFQIAQLVRVLFYTGESSNKILRVLQNQPFWLTERETKHQYWSENHMILWLSSAWLLHEKYGWYFPDPTLHERLLHFLKLKVKDGFYEFFSPTYFPYTLSALLNLADFSEDQEIKNLARQAAERLIKTCLLFVNDQGAFFPAAGRAHLNKYTDAYAQNYARLIYLVTGLGKKPSVSSPIGNFIATTDLDMSGIIASFETNVDEILHNGHALSADVHAHLNRFDQTMFQWSYGGYLHEQCIENTAWLINKMRLDHHQAFHRHAFLTQLPEWIVTLGVKQVSSVANSSVISQSNVALYKNKGVTLSSIQDFWIGHQGYQQWPWVAAVDDLAVWTQSGEVKEVWRERNKQQANASLPYLEQKSNRLLIMYKP